MFQRRLSTKQWLSLTILTLGCILQSLDVQVSVDPELEGDQTEEDLSLWSMLETSTGVFLILIQVTFGIIQKISIQTQKPDPILQKC